jgi:uncharacterized protein
MAPLPTRIARAAVTMVLGGLALLAGLLPVAAADPTYPAFSAPVVDAAHVLSDANRAEINRKLFDLQLKTGVQFAVATVPSLEGQEIEPYANGLFRAWRIGQKGVNNGLLLLLAPTERRLRFEVGYGLEGTMTDLQAKLITRNTMVPKLKAGDPAGALKAGVDDAITVLTSDKANLPERLKPSDAADQSGGIVLGVIVFVVIFAIILILASRRRGGGGGWGSWATGAAIGSSGSWSSGDSSSSGDSFSGGGGGDSGGGGSSDSY